MLLKYLYRPSWYWDETDKRAIMMDYEPILHYSNDDGETWEPIPYEEFPDREKREKLKTDFPPTMGGRFKKCQIPNFI